MNSRMNIAFNHIKRNNESSDIVFSPIPLAQSLAIFDSQKERNETKMQREDKEDLYTKEPLAFRAHTARQHSQ
jgi:hypothetical protein